MDKVMERMSKGREIQQNKKLWTERGLISQKMQEPNKPDMVFTSKPTKFQTAFGAEGSQLNPRGLSR